MEDLIDDNDDDFGAIYADVEVQASSAINSIVNFAKLYTEEEEVKEECNNNNTTKQVHPILNNGNLGSVSDSKQLNSICEKLCNSEADGSDSEDDLNIVLNEDCRGFPVAVEGNGNQDGFGEDGNEDEVGFCGVIKGCAKNGLNPNANGHGGERGNGVKGSYNLPYPQYKNVKPYELAFSSNNKVNESLEMASSSSKSAKGDMEDNRCTQLKISNTGQVANIRGSANSIVSHGGYGFSLPWYRTILDVNIDAFEEKRWRYPGVDMSDFFNFGFNEDSWKQYCISLEQCRQHSHIHSRFQSYESSKHTQAYEIGFDNEKAAQVTVAEDIAQLGFSSKSAEMGERLLGLPKGRAIQVEDSTGERQPTMDLRRPRIWDSDVVIQINVQDFDKNSSGSGQEEFHHMDDNGHESLKSRDMHADDIKDVHYSGSASEDESPAKTLGNIELFSINRCSQPMLESSQMPLDPDNHDRDHNSGADRYHHDKVNAQSIEDIAEEMGTVEKVEEENVKNTCKSDQFLTERELSVGDRSHFSLTLSGSGSDSDASRNSGYSILKMSGSPLRRQPSGTMLQEPVASDRKCPISSSTVRKLDNSQYYSRNRRSIQEGSKHQNRRLHRVPEGRIHPHTHSDASPMSRDQLSIDCRSRTGRLNDYHDGENFLYDRQRDFCSYDGERLADNKHPHRKYHQNFRDEMKLHERRNWSEDNMHDRDTDRDCDRRGLSPEGMIPPTCREPKNLVSKYNNFKETDIQWRRKGNSIQSGKKTNRDACLLDHKNLDELMLPKYGRSISATNWKRESLDEKYDSCIPFIGRETNLYGRRVRCGHSPPMNLENSWCMESEDDWDLDQQRLSSWFHRESHEANEGRWKDMMSPRSNMFDSRLAETYGRHRREISGDKCRDSHWLDSYNDINNAEDGIIYVDDQVARRRRKYSWRSGMQHRMQGDSVLRHHDDEFYAEKSSCSYEKSSRHERIHAKYGSSNGWMVVDDMQLEWHRYKMFKRESSACFINRNPNMMSRGDHVRTARRCSDPVDLILGEGKSSGRCSTTESLMFRGKFKKMDLKFAKEPDVLKDFNETRSEKATETGNSKFDGSQDNEKWLDKFPVRGHDEDLDIEEGQIMPEEPIIEDRLEKKHASGIAAPLRSIKRRNFQSQNISSGKEMKKGYDDQRILDTLAKMERRRERFKDPAALKREPDKSLKPQVDLIADTVETKQERPARKRRWGGS